jgi:hypothetical protein
MMSLYVKNNQPRELISLTQQLSALKLPPTSGLGHIVAMVSRLNDSEKLKELLVQMGNQGFILDVATTDELALHYYHTNQPDKMHELLGQLRKRNSRPGSFLMSWLVYTHIVSGKLDEALKYWLEMKNHKIPSHAILGRVHFVGLIRMSGTFGLLMHHHEQLQKKTWRLDLPTPEIEDCMKEYFLLPEACSVINQGKSN